MLVKAESRADRRKRRVRFKIAKTTKCLARLVIVRSNAHVSCQMIDAKRSVTLAAASSMEKVLKKLGASNCNASVASKVGALVAERAKALGITRVAFDRGPYKYHGVVKSFCEAARLGGLEF